MGAHEVKPLLVVQKREILRATCLGKVPQQFYVYHYLPEDCFERGGRVKVYKKRKKSRPPQAYLAALPTIGAPNPARLAADTRPGLRDDEEWVAPDRSMAAIRESLEHRGPRRAGAAEERALRARNQATEVARAAATGRASNPSSRQRLGRAFDAGDRRAAEQVRQADARAAEAEAEVEAERERRELAERRATRAEQAAPMSAERLHNSPFLQSRMNVMTGVEYGVWRGLVGMMHIKYPAGYRPYRCGSS